MGGRSGLLAPSPAGKGIVRTRGGRGAKAAVVVALALIVPSVPVAQAQQRAKPAAKDAPKEQPKEAPGRGDSPRPAGQAGRRL